MLRSLVNLASPVSSAGSSRRSIGVPITLAACSSTIVMREPAFAAARTDWTMLWYPVQRQRLPSSPMRTSLLGRVGDLVEQADRRP